MASNKYKQYVESMQRIADLDYSVAVLHWDQETYMPPKGASARARQIATLSGMSHELFTAHETGALLDDLLQSGGLSEVERRNVEESHRKYAKHTRLSKEFVESLSMAVSAAFTAWNQARKANDYALFSPALSRLIDLKLQEAAMIGYEAHPYDALLDEYEPGATVAFLDPLFEGVRGDLSRLLDKVRAKPQPEIPFAGKKFDKDRQWPVGIKLLEQMGYDFEAGRQDLSAHPFTTSFSPEDVRVTTRINEDDVLDMITSCVHEGGHALYEQGLPAGDYGLPSGEYVSLGVHESQSRLWENNVGRSLEYWQCNFPLLQQAFPDELNGCTAETVFLAANRVEPSLIRVQADELTYHFHILIRYEVEKAILSRQVGVDELPELWNSLYKQYLGLDVPGPARGVLQDVHWSHGSFGYFPTYSLGSFYAAQYFAKAESDIPGLRGLMAKGELLPLRDWLRENIHRHGKIYRADELCRRVTGAPLDVKVFFSYLEDKLGKVYGW